MQESAPENVLLHVCVTCRAGEAVPEGELCAGRKLCDALANEERPPGIEIVEVECLSACSRGAAIALVSKGRWTYVYGQLSQDNKHDILTGATAYGETLDGIVPWKERVDIFKKNVIARIPPFKEARS